MHHDDAVGHGHGLDLVVGDIDGGGLQALVQRLDLGPHRHPQFGVQVGQRLVEQKHLGVAHDRPAHRHALALAAGQLFREPVQQRAQVEDARRVVHPLGRHPGVGLAQLQAEGHVVAHRHVRVQRIALEHHRDVAVLGFEVVDDLVVDQDLAADHVAFEGVVNGGRWQRVDQAGGHQQLPG